LIKIRILFNTLELSVTISRKINLYHIKADLFV
jgi:hypothetical protein